MAKPNPQLGLVICYDYLWKSEERKGREQGVKDRPCGVIVAQAGRPDRVLVCPITHTEPDADQAGIELGPKDRAWMGLDDKPQWIITSEANLVDWADPGIVPVPATGDWHYGTMTAELATQVQAEARKSLSQGQLALISRIEKAG